MRFRDGTLPQKALFLFLLLVFLWGVGLNVVDKVERIGAPDVGFSLDDGYLSPTRRDASAAGLRGDRSGPDPRFAPFSRSRPRAGSLRDRVRACCR